MGIKHIISSKIEHHAVTHTLDDLELQGVNVHYVKLSENGNIDIDNLEHLLSFNNEPKLNLIFHKISDNIINKGENILLINFQDGVGNKGVYRATLYY